MPGQLSLLELLHELPGSIGPSGGRVDVDAAKRPEPVGAGRGEWERQVLAFAVEHHLAGRYDQLVQQHLGCSVTRYLQTLAEMLHRLEVLAAAPELVERLRALRDRRQRLRALSRGPRPGSAVSVSAPALGSTTGRGLRDNGARLEALLSSAAPPRRRRVWS